MWGILLTPPSPGAVCGLLVVIVGTHVRVVSDAPALEVVVCAVPGARVVLEGTGEVWGILLSPPGAGAVLCLPVVRVATLDVDAVSSVSIGLPKAFKGCCGMVISGVGVVSSVSSSFMVGDALVSWGVNNLH